MERDATHLFCLHKVVMWPAVTERSSGCFPGSFHCTALPLRLSLCRSLKYPDSHDRTGICDDPRKTSPKRSVGTAPLPGSVTLSFCHPHPTPLSSLPTLCWPQQFRTDTVSLVCPQQVLERGPRPHDLQIPGHVAIGRLSEVVPAGTQMLRGGNRSEAGAWRKTW